MLKMEREMAISMPRAAQWARDVANQVLVSDAKVRDHICKHTKGDAPIAPSDAVCLGYADADAY